MAERGDRDENQEVGRDPDGRADEDRLQKIALLLEQRVNHTHRTQEHRDDGEQHQEDAEDRGVHRSRSLPEAAGGWWSMGVGAHARLRSRASSARTNARARARPQFQLRQSSEAAASQPSAGVYQSPRAGLPAGCGAVSSQR